MRVGSIKLWLVVLLLLLGLTAGELDPEFKVDWKNNAFLKDGRLFQFISGSFDYFRSQPQSWSRKLRMMRATGLNTVATYVDWSLHNPYKDSYVWDGLANIELFLKLANEQELLVILRAGPYIGGERDMGGLPFWLLQTANMKLRSTHGPFMKEVEKWFDRLMVHIIPHLYANGGPIIMIQMENEYGSQENCDDAYILRLHDLFYKHIGDKAVLFLNNVPEAVNCSYYDGILTALDFGPTQNAKPYWDFMRKHQPKGPLINMEFYTGWAMHWMGEWELLRSEFLTYTLQELLGAANFNFYMFYGGTNFGFSAGAGKTELGKYKPFVTTYNYDAPMDEIGNARPKLYNVRDAMSKLIPFPDVGMPKKIESKRFGRLHLNPCNSLLSKNARDTLSTGSVNNKRRPMSFEALNQRAGLVLYETLLPKGKPHLKMLNIDQVHDIAYVYADNIYLGMLSRMLDFNKLLISTTEKTKLQILVESQGRMQYGIVDRKGILGNITIGGIPLQYWNMTKFPFEKYEDITAFKKKGCLSLKNIRGENLLRGGPVVFYGSFNIIQASEVRPTYLDTRGWGKGVAFVNGHNLGRYWPVVGPQLSLYVPDDILKVGSNEVVMLEYEQVPPNNDIFLVEQNVIA